MLSLAPFFINKEIFQHEKFISILLLSLAIFFVILNLSMSMNFLLVLQILFYILFFVPFLKFDSRGSQLIHSTICKVQSAMAKANTPPNFPGVPLVEVPPKEISEVKSPPPPETQPPHTFPPDE
jgi:hypothetical protein